MLSFCAKPAPFPSLKIAIIKNVIEKVFLTIDLHVYLVFAASLSEDKPLKHKGFHTPQLRSYKVITL